MKKLRFLLLLALFPLFIQGQSVNPYTGLIDLTGGLKTSYTSGGVAYFVLMNGDTVSSDTLYDVSIVGRVADIEADTSNWQTAYSDRLKWDGGSTGLTPSTGRQSLGANTIGSNLFIMANPGAVRYLRLNADNTVSQLSAAEFKTALGYLTGTDTASIDARLQALEAGGGGGGYTDLTEFVDQTAWRVFYSNGDGDVTELALGADGTYLKSNGATSAPTWATPAGSGDVSLSDSTDVFVTPTQLKDSLNAQFAGADTAYTTTEVDSLLALKKNIADVEPIYTFQSGFGNSMDSIAFMDGNVLGAFFNRSADTLVITDIVTGIYGESGDSMKHRLMYHKEYRNMMEATVLDTVIVAVEGVTSTGYTHTETTSKIPPDVWVWSAAIGPLDGIRPAMWHSTISGYKIRGELSSDPFPVVYNAEFDTVLMAMTYNMHDTLKTIYNTFVDSLVSSGIWEITDYLHIGAVPNNDNGEALINWITPGTNDATHINTPIWTAFEGYEGDSLNNGRINTNFNPAQDAVNFSQNSAAITLYVRKTSEGPAYAAVTTTHYIDGKPQSADGVQTWRLNSANGGGQANAEASGIAVWSHVRDGATSQILYKNGVVDDVENDSSTGMPDANIQFFTTVTLSQVSNYQIPIFIVSAALDADKVSRLFNFCKTLMTDLGTNVID